MSLDAIILNPNDNVATAVRRLDNGEPIGICKNISITLCRDIPLGHKFALRDIARGEKVVKYGEIIGQATADIIAGEHVHVDNVEGLRGRGDKQ